MNWRGSDMRIRAASIDVEHVVKRAREDVLLTITSAIISPRLWLAYHMQVEAMEALHHMRIEVLKALWRWEIAAKRAKDAELKLREYRELLNEAKRCWAKDADEFLARWKEQRRRGF